MQRFLIWAVVLLIVVIITEEEAAGDSHQGFEREAETRIIAKASRVSCRKCGQDSGQPTGVDS